ncbi:MAG: FAD:protein FMN transferase [Acidobacteria bacterium]|nr:FAD:protein FMN transferase [Acidobacteriota bacterium]
MIRILAPAPLLLALLAPTPQVDREVLAMGTRLRIQLSGPAAALAGEGLVAEVARIEAACSTWEPTSSWSRLNGAGGRPVRLDAEWLGLLGECQRWARRTEGAFDPVLMALLKVWGTREGGRNPGPRELLEAREASGVGLLYLDAEMGTARLRVAGAGVEEGAFLKGYALDAGRRRARALGVATGCLDFGGQLLAWGDPAPVSIADPANRTRPRVSLQLRDESLSTSGCSERGRHILDPRSGQPCEAWGSVSVLAPSALEADILSTALYVLGPAAGAAWAEREGVAALFLHLDGRVGMSSRFRSHRPTLTNGDPL